MGDPRRANLGVQAVRSMKIRGALCIAKIFIHSQVQNANLPQFDPLVGTIFCLR
jgi:hypothetical protein